MSLNNNKSSESQQIIIFAVLIVTIFLLLFLYLPSYVLNNPPICKQEDTVKEILAISGTKAKIKISDGSIRNEKIEKYNNQEQKFNSYIKVNKPICLKYKNPFDYYLAYILSK